MSKKQDKLEPLIVTDDELKESFISDMTMYGSVQLICEFCNIDQEEFARLNQMHDLDSCISDAYDYRYTPEERREYYQKIINLME